MDVEFSRYPEMNQMAPIGFNSGSLKSTGLNLIERLILYRKANADMVELNFMTPELLFEFSADLETINILKEFSYVSIHGPAKNITYGKGTCEEVLEKLQKLCSQLPIKGIVIHPNTVEDYSFLEDTGLPFLIENMDKRKDTGTHPDDFRRIKDLCSFNFVFDVQHAYEHDSTMKMAKELIEVMGERLQHMHTSGCSETSLHVPVHLSENRKAIEIVLKMTLPVPKVNEGSVKEQPEKTVQKELNYLRSFEV